MNTLAHRRHDLSDHVWDLLEPHLPGRGGSWGGRAKDNRQFINAVFWILRTGAPWRDLPPDYGCWSNTHRRFIRWRDKGIWEKLLEKLVDKPDFEWLMIDGSHTKVYPHAAGEKGGNQKMSRSKGGSTPRYIWLLCVWYAGQSTYYRWYHSRLHASFTMDRRNKC